MSEHPGDQQFFRYLDGEMNSDQEREFLDHVENCTRCGDQLDQLRQEEQRLSETLNDTPDTGSIKNDVMSQIDASESDESSALIDVLGSSTTSRVMKVAASLIVLFGIGVLVYRQMGPQPQMTETPVGEGRQAMEETPQSDDAGKLRSSPGEDKPSQLAQTSRKDKTQTSGETGSMADDRPPVERYDVRHRTVKQLLGSARKRFPEVDFHREKKSIEFTSTDEETLSLVSAYLDRNDTVPTNDETARERFRIALDLEKNARGPAARTAQPMAVSRTQDESKMSGMESNERLQSAKVSKDQQTKSDKWSRKDLRKANDHYRSTRRAPGISPALKSRASIHIAINHFRMGEPQKGIREYKFWRKEFGNTGEFPPEERELLDDLNKRYHRNRLHQLSWYPMTDGVWELTEDNIIRARPDDRDRPAQERLLVHEKNLSDTNHVVKTSIKPIDGKGVAGLVFGIKGSPQQREVREFIIYAYNPINDLQILTRWQSSKPTPDALWTQSRSLDTKGWLTLRVEINGKKVSLYFNDKLSHTVTLDRISQARAGLIQGPDPVLFKNFSLTSKNRQ